MPSFTTPPRSRTTQVARVVGVVIMTLGPFLVAAALLSWWIPDPLVATGVLGVTTAFVGVGLRARRPRWFEHKPVPARLPSAYPWWALGALLVTFLAGQVLGTWLYLHLGSSAFDQNVDQQRASGGLITLTLVLLAAPMGEEALFRGLLQPLLRRQVRLLTTMVITSMMFAGLHGNIMQLASTLPLACALTLLFEHTRRLWPCIVLHVGFNALAVLTPTQLVQGLASPASMAFLLLACTGYLLLWHQSATRLPGDASCQNQGSEVLGGHPPHRT